MNSSNTIVAPQASWHDIKDMQKDFDIYIGNEFPHESSSFWRIMESVMVQLQANNKAEALKIVQEFDQGLDEELAEIHKKEKAAQTQGRVKILINKIFGRETPPPVLTEKEGFYSGNVVGLVTKLYEAIETYSPQQSDMFQPDQPST